MLCDRFHRIYSPQYVYSLEGIILFAAMLGKEFLMPLKYFNGHIEDNISIRSRISRLLESHDPAYS